MIALNGGYGVESVGAVGAVGGSEGSSGCVMDSWELDSWESDGREWTRGTRLMFFTNPSFFCNWKIGMSWVRLNEEVISGLLCNRLLQGLKLSMSKRGYR